MKNFVVASLFALFGASAGAQPLIRYEEHMDAGIQRQADSIKRVLVNNGFIIVKENSVNMESQFEFPVIVPLNAGTLYQFVFIGEMSSKIYEVRMYDWSEKQVFYKKNMWGDIDGNIITFRYTPPQDEYHMMKVLQINKTKKTDIAGYVMLFRRTHSQLELEEQQKRLNTGAAPAAPAPSALPESNQPVSSDTTVKKKKNNYDQYLKGN
jgi:hypothetical protein